MKQMKRNIAWHKGPVPVAGVLLGIGLIAAYLLFFAPAAFLAVQ